MSRPVRATRLFMTLALLASCSSSPSAPSTSLPPSNPSFRWTVRVANPHFKTQATTPAYRPVRLEGVTYVEAGPYRFERAQIALRQLVAPQVATWQAEQKIARETLAAQRQAQTQANAEAAQKRREEAQKRIQAQLTAARQRQQAVATPSPFRVTQATAPTPQPSLAPSPASSPPPEIQLTFNASNGQFSLERSDGQPLPVMLRMKVEGLEEPLSIPVITHPQATRPMHIAAQADQKGHTDISGSFKPITTQADPLFTVDREANQETLSWTDSAGQTSSLDLGALGDLANSQAFLDNPGLQIDSTAFQELSNQLNAMASSFSESLESSFVDFGDGFSESGFSESFNSDF